MQSEMSYPIEDQIACVKRELAMRRRVYTRRVESGQMDPDEMEREIGLMAAVLSSLEALNPVKQMSLI